MIPIKIVDYPRCIFPLNDIDTCSCYPDIIDASNHTYSLNANYLLYALKEAIISGSISYKDIILTIKEANDEINKSKINTVIYMENL